MEFKVWDNRDKCWIEDSSLSNLLKPEFFFLNHIGELFYHNPSLYDRHGPEKCGDGEYTAVFSAGIEDFLKKVDGDLLVDELLDRRCYSVQRIGIDPVG